MFIIDIFLNCLKINIFSGVTIGLELPGALPPAQAGMAALFFFFIIVTHSCQRMETSNICAPRDPK